MRPTIAGTTDPRSATRQPVSSSNSRCMSMTTCTVSAPSGANPRFTGSLQESPRPPAGGEGEGEGVSRKEPDAAGPSEPPSPRPSPPAGGRGGSLSARVLPSRLHHHAMARRPFEPHRIAGGEILTTAVLSEDGELAPTDIDLVDRAHARIDRLPQPPLEPVAR